MSISEPPGSHTPAASSPCVADATRQPANRPLDFIGNLLAPLFLAGCAGNVALARQTADETVASYEAWTAEDLATIAQLIALGIVALDTLRLSMDESLSVTMRLRLRNCANAMNRSIRQHSIAWQTTRAQRPPPHRPPQHSPEDPSAAQDLETMIARAQGMLEDFHLQVASLQSSSCADSPVAANNAYGVAGASHPPPPHPAGVTVPAIAPTGPAAAKPSPSATAAAYSPPAGVISVSNDGVSAATGADAAPSTSADAAPSTSGASAQQAAIAASADPATAAPASVPPKPDKPQGQPERQPERQPQRQPYPPTSAADTSTAAAAIEAALGPASALVHPAIAASARPSRSMARVAPSLACLSLDADQERRMAWSTSMGTVAVELMNALPTVPVAQRKTDMMWIESLLGTASELALQAGSARSAAASRQRGQPASRP